jgi:hypothetical protein
MTRTVKARRDQFSPPADRRDHGWRRKASTGLFIAFCVALLASAWILLFVPAHPHTTQVTPPPAAPSAPPDAAGSVCGLPAGDQQIPGTTPPGTTWATYGTMAAPVSTTIGPGITDTDVPYCYAHSPLGALYAAAGLLAVCTDPAHRAPAARHLTATGPGRDALLRQISGNTGVGGAGSPDQQIAGFRVTNYDPNSASIDLAVRDGQEYAHTLLALRWESGDWKVVPTDAGQLWAFQPLPNLSQYVPWAGR